MEIQNRKIPEGEFMAMRQEVLQQWPTLGIARRARAQTG